MTDSTSSVQMRVVLGGVELRTPAKWRRARVCWLDGPESAQAPLVDAVDVRAGLACLLEDAVAVADEPLGLLGGAKLGVREAEGAYENDGLHWPRRDGLKWPHLASVVGVVVDVA